jgi:hypothetical protein
MYNKTVSNTIKIIYIFYKRLLKIPGNIENKKPIRFNINLILAFKKNKEPEKI